MHGSKERLGSSNARAPYGSNGKRSFGTIPRLQLAEDVACGAIVPHARKRDARVPRVTIAAEDSSERTLFEARAGIFETKHTGKLDRGSFVFSVLGLDRLSNDPHENLCTQTIPRMSVRDGGSNANER